MKRGDKQNRSDKTPRKLCLEMRKLEVFWYFQGVQKEISGIKWVNNINLDTMVSHRLKVMEDTDHSTMLGKEKKQMDKSQTKK